MNDLELLFDDYDDEELFMSNPIINGVDEYNKLRNLPSINGHTIIGNMSASELGLQDICFGTTEHWRSQLDFIPAAGQIVIYTDYGTINDGEGGTKNVPGIKIGDGIAYGIDLPFVGEDTTRAIIHELNLHIQNQDVHVSAADRLRWDQKVNVRMNQEDPENIEFFR